MLSSIPARAKHWLMVKCCETQWLRMNHWGLRMEQPHTPGTKPSPREDKCSIYFNSSVCSGSTEMRAYLFTGLNELVPKLNEHFQSILFNSNQIHKQIRHLEFNWWGTTRCERVSKAFRKSEEKKTTRKSGLQAYKDLIALTVVTYSQDKTCKNLILLYCSHCIM